MDSHSLAVLEFPAVLAVLAREAASELGRQRAESLVPTGDPALVGARLAETAEARVLLREAEPAGLDRARDVRAAVSRASIVGARLSPDELLATADTLEAAAAMRRMIRGAREAVPRLERRAEALRAFPELVTAVRRSVLPDGTVADVASPRLAALRGQARDTRERVRELLHGLLFAPRLAAIVAEPIVTIRNERYVIPVTPDYRSRLAGVVQDQSASGHTLFVEPLQAIELNNGIRRLEREAEAEADRILGELTALVGAHAREIADTIEAVADLDLILAKARLAERWEAGAPQLLEGGDIALRRARHPLLVEARRGRADEIVPIDVILPAGVRALVITGPNAGGKTVALKTVGLAALCTQAGLHIPAAPDSALPVFRAIFADIGDEQNIAQDLSTFSAHVRRVQAILGEAGARDLVLIDELGAGTDPGEGAALGSAVLEALGERGAACVATTHLDGIKAFVANHAKMLNAAVEFDLDKMAPAYRLHLGLPGRSYAIEIACRLGIPPSIIHRARELAGDASSGVDTLLARLQALEAARADDAGRAAAARTRAEAERAAAAASAAELRHEVAQVRARASRIISEVGAEARRRVEAAIADLRRGASPRETRAAVEDLARVREEGLADLPEPEPAVAPAAPGALAPGQRVRIVHLGQVGSVVSMGPGVVEVQLPLGKTRVAPEQLEVVAAPPRAASAGVSWTAGLGDALSPEINVIGLRVDEATARVQRYLEDAVLGGLSRVRIIHGKGTGRLRQGVAALLRTHPLVSGFQLASFEEGGAGATVVEVGPRETAAPPAEGPGQQGAA